MVELTPVERDIMDQVAFGLTNDMIADNMGYARNTINSKLKGIYKKLDLDHLDDKVFITRIVAIRRYNGT